MLTPAGRNLGVDLDKVLSDRAPEIACGPDHFWSATDLGAGCLRDAKKIREDAEKLMALFPLKATRPTPPAQPMTELVLQMNLLDQKIDQVLVGSGCSEEPQEREEAAEKRHAEVVANQTALLASQAALFRLMLNHVATAEWPRAAVFWPAHLDESDGFLTRLRETLLRKTGMQVRMRLQLCCECHMCFGEEVKVPCADLSSVAYDVNVPGPALVRLVPVPVVGVRLMNLALRLLNAPVDLPVPHVEEYLSRASDFLEREIPFAASEEETFGSVLEGCRRRRRACGGRCVCGCEAYGGASLR